MVLILCKSSDCMSPSQFLQVSPSQARGISHIVRSRFSSRCYLRALKGSESRRCGGRRIWLIVAGALDALAVDALGFLARAFGLALPNDDCELACPCLKRILQTPIDLWLTGVDSERSHLVKYTAPWMTRGISLGLMLGHLDRVTYRQLLQA